MAGLVLRGSQVVLRPVADVDVPALENERAVHVYEKLGFRRVGVMRRYERGADGAWHDGLLTELLAEEFARA